MNSTLLEIMNNINKNNLEVEVWKLLNTSIESKLNELHDNNMEQSASLRAIKKINNGKNEAIDALCEVKHG